jgi:hypothetical protein
MTKKREEELVDASTLVSGEVYLAWFVAAAESARALRAWLDGSAREHGALYGAYRAALDREEAAACNLQRLSAAAGGHAVYFIKPIRGRGHTAPVAREMPRSGLTGE